MPQPPRQILRTALFTVLTVIGLPLALLLVVEGIFRLSGYGYDPHFYRIEERNGEQRVRENREFSRLFFPKSLVRVPSSFSIPLEKPDETVRIFVLGGSVAAGDPDPAFSFSRMLQVMLEESYPEHQFEVVNAAITAANSHVMVSAAHDLKALDPDLFVVYMGNNEVVGPYGPGTVFAGALSSRNLIRANISLQHWRFGQWLHQLFAGSGDDLPKNWGGLKLFLEHPVSASDPRLERTYDQLAENLLDIYEAAQDAKAGLLLSTVSVNLKDLAPFHGEKARTAFEEGKRLFRERYFSAGATAFMNARDLDELRFRADSVINSVIREIGTQGAQESLYLADAELMLAQLSEDILPGYDLFLEHVHFNFAGNYALARSLYPAIAASLSERGVLDGVRGTQVDPNAMKEHLAFTVFEERQILNEMLSRFHKAPFKDLPYTEEPINKMRARSNRIEGQLQRKDSRQQLLEAHSKALAARPDDWMLKRNMGELLMAYGQFAEAARYFEEALEYLPGQRHLRWEYAAALTYAGRAEEALPILKDIVTTDPRSRSVVARDLAAAALRTEDFTTAEKNALYLTKETPDNPENWVLLARVRLARGFTHTADQAVARAIALSPEDPLALATIGQLYLDFNQPRKAGPYVAKALRINPELAQVQEVAHRLQNAP